MSSCWNTSYLPKLVEPLVQLFTVSQICVDTRLEAITAGSEALL